MGCYGTPGQSIQLPSCPFPLYPPINCTGQALLDMTQCIYGQLHLNGHFFLPSSDASLVRSAFLLYIVLNKRVDSRVPHFFLQTSHPWSVNLSPAEGKWFCGSHLLKYWHNLPGWATHAVWLPGGVSISERSIIGCNAQRFLPLPNSTHDRGPAFMALTH